MTKKIFKKKDNRTTAILKEAALTGAECGVALGAFWGTIFIGKAAEKAARKGIAALGGRIKKGAAAPDTGDEV